MAAVIATVLFACSAVPAIAWNYPQKTVLQTAEQSYGLTKPQLARLKFCISHPRPGETHGARR